MHFKFLALLLLTLPASGQWTNLLADKSLAGWESIGDVWIDGEPGGWGFLEANINPRNGHSAPAFVLGDALTNGIIHAEP